MMTTPAFSWPNAIWSLCLFGIAIGCFWWKMHLLRLEIHNLVTCLPEIGSEFIKREIAELRIELERTQARVKLCEERQGINGECP